MSILRSHEIHDIVYDINTCTYTNQSYTIHLDTSLIEERGLPQLRIL